MKDLKKYQGLLLVFLCSIAFYWALTNHEIVFNVINVIWGYLFPFFLGIGIAFLLNIPMHNIEKWLIKAFPKLGQAKPKIMRVLSLLLTLFLVLFIIIGVVLIVIPQIGITLNNLALQVPGFIKECQVFIENLLQELPDLNQLFGTITIDWEKMASDVASMFSSIGTGILSSSLTMATSVFSGLVNFFLGFIFSIYLLIGKEVLTRQAHFLIKALFTDETYDEIMKIAHLIYTTFSNFFSGQCLEAIILGCMFFVGMIIFRFPYATLVSVLISITALIPIFGAFIACAIGTFFILVDNPMQAVWFIVFFLVIQQIEGNLIYPKVVGSSIGLPSMWVLVAVTVGGSMMGVMGMLIFIPATSVVYTLLRNFVRRRLDLKNSIQQTT